MKRLFLVIFLALPAHAAMSQSFFDDFAGTPATDFAAADNNWETIWSDDSWCTSANTGGLSPNTDTTGTGASFGAPADAFDNGIVTGEDTWRDYAVEADFFVEDDDGLGLIFRYTSANNYYVIILTRDLMPGTSGSIISTGGQETRLYKISNSTAKLMATATGVGHKADKSLRQRVRVNVAGNTIMAWIGEGNEPVNISQTPIINLTDSDNDALTAGKAGVYAFAMGSESSGTYFDSFRVKALDSDGDGRNNNDEYNAGTDPFDADSDDDGVMDGKEYLWTQDSDNDGLINALDWDSDNDNLPDGLELSVTVPTLDTDISAGHYKADEDPSTSTDHLNPDSDDGGFNDGAEDLNKNGKYEPDLGETNPNNSADDGNFPDGGADGDTDGDTDIDSDSGDNPDTHDSSDAGIGTLCGGHDCSCSPPGTHRNQGLLSLIAKIL